MCEEYTLPSLLFEGVLDVCCMYVHTTIEGRGGQWVSCSIPSYSFETGSLIDPGAHRLANPSKHPASAHACVVLAKLMLYVGAGDLNPGPSVSP